MGDDIVRARPRAAFGRHRGSLLLALLLALGLSAGVRAAPGPGPASPSGASSSAAGGLISWWVELGPQGVLARAITSTPSCPVLTLDGAKQAMAVRSAASGTDFPVTVCEGKIPAATKHASIAGHALPLLTGTPRRIAVVGDTGCRLIASEGYQDCNSSTAWPFAQIAHQIAAWHPDLIIHVGDYLYRLSPCPLGNTGCAGSPWGDRWAAWDADFFNPAASLLGAAPIVFVRGNHETCSRGGAGWFRFLDPRQYTPNCSDYTDPYAVSAGALRLLVMDSAAANDTAAAQGQTSIYQQQFAALTKMAGPTAWLLTHKPLWAIQRVSGSGTAQQITANNPALEAAAPNYLPAGVQLVLSGHVHRSEVLGYASSAHRPPQIVSGNGGSALDHGLALKLPGTKLAGATLSGGEIESRFGFVTLQPAQGGWTVSERDPSGTIWATCSLGHNTAACT